MDSITQALLGGAVGTLVAGRANPRRAWLYGAAAGVLPDLDVFIRYASDLDNFTQHRGFSHSWLVHTAVAPLLGLSMARLDRTFSVRTWIIMLWLVFVTHAALDALTVYGTQLFWPLPVPPVMGGSIFIIDPLYSLPLLVAAVWILLRPRTRALKAGALGLAVSCAYLLFGLTAQLTMSQRVSAELQRQGISAEHVAVTAAPFTTLLWRIVVMSDEHYLQAYASILDDTGNIRFASFPRGNEVARLLADSHAYRQFMAFSHGFGAAERIDDQLVVKDLRMGSEPVYAFRFVIRQRRDDQWIDVLPYALERQSAPPGFFEAIWQRIWSTEPDTRLIAMTGFSQENR